MIKQQKLCEDTTWNVSGAYPGGDMGVKTLPSMEIFSNFFPRFFNIKKNLKTPSQKFFHFVPEMYQPKCDCFCIFL